MLTVCQHEFDNRANYYKLNNAKNTQSLVSNLNDYETSTEEEKKAAVEAAHQASKKKMLGNVKFIGELGRLDLLSEAILHKCIKTLLEKQKDEKYSDMAEDLECLCKIMPTIGKKLDQGEAVKLMDQYFERMKKLKSINTNKDSLPQRIRFLLQDCIDLRANNWVPRQTQLDQAPKTMNEVRNGSNDSQQNKQQQQHQDIATSTANYLVSSFSGNSSSSLMMNMFQQLSHQPNMSLLNAINGIANSINKTNIIANTKKIDPSYYCNSDDYLESGTLDNKQNDDPSTTNINTEQKNSDILNSSSSNININTNNNNQEKETNQDNYLKLSKTKTPPLTSVSPSQTINNLTSSKITENSNYNNLKNSTKPISDSNQNDIFNNNHIHKPINNNNSNQVQSSYNRLNNGSYNYNQAENFNSFNNNINYQGIF